MILYESFHTIDVDTEETRRRKIPNDFTAFINEYVDYAAQNSSYIAEDKIVVQFDPAGKGYDKKLNEMETSLSISRIYQYVYGSDTAVELAGIARNIIIAAVCIRTSTERPEALEAGDFILAGITTKELLNATDMAIEMKQKGVLGKPCPDYVDETVSMKVVRIIQGYVNVVNKMVWRKDQ